MGGGTAFTYPIGGRFSRVKHGFLSADRPPSTALTYFSSNKSVETPERCLCQLRPPLSVRKTAPLLPTAQPTLSFRNAGAFEAHVVGAVNRPRCHVSPAVGSLQNCYYKSLQVSPLSRLQ